MSDDDVHRNSMDGPFEFDDDAAEALIAGRGAGIDRQLSELVGDIRTHFSTATPAVGLELSTFFREEPMPRLVRSRARFGAKVAAAVAACLAATSGLAVAGALPGPVQHAVSRAAGGIGVHVPDQHHGSGQPRVVVAASDETTTTGGNVSTTTEPDDSSKSPNGTHGAEVSAVAHDPSLTGCAHGAAVASIASGTTKTPACVKSSTTTTTTDLAPVTTTTKPGNRDEHGPPVTHGKSKSGLDVVPPTDPPGRSGTGG